MGNRPRIKDVNLRKKLLRVRKYFTKDEIVSALYSQFEKMRQEKHSMFVELKDIRIKNGELRKELEKLKTKVNEN